MRLGIAKSDKCDSRSVIDWWEYAISYFTASEALLLAPVSGEAAPLFRELPASYCLKHGTELLLKFLALAFGQPLRPGHSLRELLADIPNNLRTIEEWQIRDVARRFAMDPEVLRRFTSISADQLITVVERYHRHSALGADDILDSKNRLFRYPSILSNGKTVTAAELEDSVDRARLLADAHMLVGITMSLTAFLWPRQDGDQSV